MALNLWQRAKITSVFSPAGPDSSGEVKYTRQNFDIMRWKGPGGTKEETWVVSPRADSYLPIGLIENFTKARNNSTNVLDEGLAQDFGFYTAERLVINGSRNPKDGAGESVLDFHFFGPV